MLIYQLQERISSLLLANDEDRFCKLTLSLMQEPSVYSYKNDCIFYKSFEPIYGISSFLIEETNNIQVKRILKELISYFEKDDFRSTLLKTHNNDLNGLELANDEHTQFCLFSRETYSGQTHMVRATLFDHRGFINHIADKTWELLLKECVSNGYFKIATGTLERLSKTDAFINGNKRICNILKSASS